MWQGSASSLAEIKDIWINPKALTRLHFLMHISDAEYILGQGGKM